MLQAQNYNHIEETWARWRTEWEAKQVAGPPPAVEVSASAQNVCCATKNDGRPCMKPSKIEGRCSLHHGVHLRDQEKPRIRAIFRELNHLFRGGARVAEMRAHTATAQVGLSPKGREKVRVRMEYLIHSVHILGIQVLFLNNGTLEDAIARVQTMVINLEITHEAGEDLMRYAAAEQRHIAWVLGQEQEQQQARRWGAEHREAALAADSQNVHTAEISAQMKDGVAALLAVQVPITQTNTAAAIKASWESLGSPPAEVQVVYADMVAWWNKTTIYTAEDKLYRKCMRALWYTITSFKGEVRTELEKRLWDECRDGALPYTVCTQGHMARLCNVLIGFDDAFKPVIPVGEILQQKMAAIAAMDVEYEEQIKLAENLLEELKIPSAEHANWLSAF